MISIEELALFGSVLNLNSVVSGLVRQQRDPVEFDGDKVELESLHVNVDIVDSLLAHYFHYLVLSKLLNVNMFKDVFTSNSSL